MKITSFLLHCLFSFKHVPRSAWFYNLFILGLLENVVTSIVKKLLQMDFNAPGYICSISLILGLSIYSTIAPAKTQDLWKPFLFEYEPHK